MSQIRITLTLLAVALFGSACATTNGLVPHRPEYHLVVRAPRSIIREIDPKNFTFNITIKSWGDRPDGHPFTESHSVYCILRQDPESKSEVFECLATFHEPNMKFELDAVWLQPDFSAEPPEAIAEFTRRWEEDDAFRKAEFARINPPHFCDKVRVGISINTYGFSGGIPTATHWFDLEPKLPANWCQYWVPRQAIHAAEAEQAKHPQERRVLTK